MLNSNNNKNLGKYMKIMELLRLNLVVVILYFVFFVPVISQQQIESQKNEEKNTPIFWLGAYANYNYNIHLAEFTELPGYPSCCPKFETGNGSGISIGALFSYPIVPALSFDFRLGISSLGSYLTKNENIGNTIVKQVGSTGNVIRDVTVEHSINSSLLAIDLEPGLTFRFFKSVVSQVGFKFGYFLNMKFDIQEKIVSPDNVVFLDGRLVRNDFAAQDIPDKNQILAAGVIGLGYELPIMKDGYLTPEIRYNLPFTNISSVSWKPAVFQFGASIKFPIYKSKEKPIIKDTTYLRDTIIVPNPNILSEKIELIDRKVKFETEEFSDRIVEETKIFENYKKEIPPTSVLSVKVDAVGVTKDGRKQLNPTIIIEENVYQESFPLLPYIFFKEGSADLTKTDLKLLTKQETSSFIEDSLEWNTMSIYSDLLNIIGSRLKKNPRADLVITGCNKNIGEELNNTNLSKKRAESVKNYLTDVWGINPGLISIKYQNLPNVPGNNTILDGQVENQRAEINSSNPNIMKHIVLKDIKKTSNPPLVEILPDVKSNVGVKSWNLNVEQNNKPIRTFGGEDVPNIINWEIEKEPIPQLDTPVNINLTVTDQLQQKKSDEKNISIQQKTIESKRIITKDDKIIEKYSLILFDYDKADISQRNRTILLNEIKGSIKPNSKVSISGFTDRTGDPAYNKELAMKRALEVQKILDINSSNLTINPVGNDEIIFDNNTPQGRSYSRTVEIIIETPIK